MEKEMKYEWDLTFRIEHWVRFIAVVILVVTGFYIHWPFMPGGPDSFIMEWMRFFHFVSAYALMLGLIVRIYLAFNERFSSDYMDFGIGEKFFGIGAMFGYYLFIKDSHKDYGKYNPLQELEYILVALMICFTALTGAALYKGHAFGFINTAVGFRWVNNLLGGESYVRIWHFLSMWIIIILVMVHVYMTVLKTLVDRDRTFTSIFTGYKLKKKSS
jgi:Ni/Fe-hydrogenase 1 B-type cytochrome subunit